MNEFTRNFDMRFDAFVVAPIAVWVFVHLSYPDDTERVRLFGLQIGQGVAASTRLAMHAVTHGSWEHLLQNCAVHALAASTMTLPPSLRYLPRWLFGGWLMVGGAVAGIVATMHDADRRTRQFQDRHGLGIGVVRSVLGTVHRTARSYRYFCGGSAAISAVMGYNAGRATQPVMVAAMLCGVAGDVLALLRDEENAITFWSGVSSVAHAGHVGGFAFGFVAAKLFDCIDVAIRRRRAQPAPLFAGGHPLGT
jgi:membrane associated rhomboid family serine protease